MTVLLADDGSAVYTDVPAWPLGLAGFGGRSVHDPAADAQTLTAGILALHGADRVGLCTECGDSAPCKTRRLVTEGIRRGHA